MIWLFQKHFVDNKPVWSPDGRSHNTLDRSVAQYTGGLVTMEKDLSSTSLGLAEGQMFPELAHLVIGLEGVSHQVIFMNWTSRMIQQFFQSPKQYQATTNYNFTFSMKTSLLFVFLTCWWVAEDHFLQAARAKVCKNLKNLGLFLEFFPFKNEGGRVRKAIIQQVTWSDLLINSRYVHTPVYPCT